MKVVEIKETFPYVWNIPWRYVHFAWDALDEMFDWASKNYDKDGFVYHDMTFRFRSEQDLIMFSLRWTQ